jgi:hypothetical protein
MGTINCNKLTIKKVKFQFIMIMVKFDQGSVREVLTLESYTMIKFLRPVVSTSVP